jgi:threonine dehydratase
MSVSLDDILQARQRITDGIYASPCPESIPLSELCGMDVFCKLEYLQRTGSFKERGARNAMLLLTPEQRAAGVVAASAGNHALGLAYHGSLLGVRVTVVMPRFAPLIKVTTCRRLGATIILFGETYTDARQHALQLAEQTGATFIHGFNDPAIIAGQGTVGLEILEQVPDLDAVIVPIGGGGLVAGVGLAIKSIRPATQVIGVEPAHAASFSAALAAKHCVPVKLEPTLADGLAVGEVGDLAFSIARRYVDRVIRASEEALSLAVLRLVELEKSVVEGAGAAPLAAAIEGQLADLAGRRVVLLLSGGNIDPMVLTRVIEKGLVADGRLCRFTAVISDRPGGLARLAKLIGDTGASIKEIMHDRAFSGPDITAAHALCTVETADAEHIRLLYEALRADGIRVLTAS